MIYLFYDLLVSSGKYETIPLILTKSKRDMMAYILAENIIPHQISDLIKIKAYPQMIQQTSLFRSTNIVDVGFDDLIDNLEEKLQNLKEDIKIEKNVDIEKQNLYEFYKFNSEHPDLVNDLAPISRNTEINELFNSIWTLSNTIDKIIKEVIIYGIFLEDAGRLNILNSEDFVNYQYRFFFMKKMMLIFMRMINYHLDADSNYVLIERNSDLLELCYLFDRYFVREYIVDTLRFPPIIANYSETDLIIRLFSDEINLYMKYFERKFSDLPRKTHDIIGHISKSMMDSKKYRGM